MEHSGKGSWSLPSPLNPYLVMFIIITVAAALRVWPLGTLGTRIPWLTFYPAVMGAALYGGFFSGLAGAAMACSIIIFGWPLLVDRPFMQGPPDWLGAAIFFLNCLMISAMAEGMRRAQARANRAREEADAANRIKSVFLANMSHELRTPLNAILGFSNLLKNDPTLQPDQHRSLLLIHRSGRHLLALIDDVLDLSKVESGHLTVDKLPVDLGSLVHDLTEILGARARERGLQLEVEQAEGVPRYVLSDDLRLRQVFQNLLGNALRYTPTGSVILRLDARPSGVAPETTLLIEVEDTGRGIAPQDQSRIFDPFVQVGVNPEKQGAGLGLAITKRIVELMGGHIRVESTLGVGSVFRVEIPMNLPEASQLVGEETDPGGVPVLAPGQPIPRILIVEDQEENWRLLQALMTRAGFPVKIAENGLQGVELFRSWKPDFIWMDCRMPVMDGLEAARRIRNLEASEGRGKPVRIVALTASVFPEERERVLKAGMDDFIRKPFGTAELFGCLSRQLGLRFLCAATPAPELPQHDPSRLDSLPDSLRQSLIEAVLSLDAERIASAIGGVSQIDPALGATLTRDMEALAYSRILNLLKTRADD